MGETSDNAAEAPIEMLDAQIRHPDIVSSWRVNGINWRVGAGEFWAVGGLHWSGKTNLLLTAAGINLRYRGRLRLFGRELADMTEEERLRERLRVGVVFGGDGRLMPDRSIAENVALPLRYLRGVDDEEMEERVGFVLDRLGLMDVARDPAGGVDLGRRRRAALARAVVLRPEAVLFDQPLEGLDPRQRAWWRKLLCSLREGHELVDNRPVALVVATEDLRPWLDVADRFALLDEGRFHAVGDRRALEECGLLIARELLEHETTRN